MSTQTSSRTEQAVWTDPDTFALTMLTLFIDRFGTEGLTWDPATIVLEIESTWGVALARLNYDRLLVGIQLITTDQFYKSLPDFIEFCNVLSGSTYNPALWDPADAMEVAWGITESLLIYPPDEEEPFTDEIRAYIGTQLDAEGIMNAPDILQIALRNSGLDRDVQAEFSDDPEMFSAIYDAEAGKTEDINTGIRQNLKMLLAQLQQLELTSGSTKNVLQMLSKAGE